MSNNIRRPGKSEESIAKYESLGRKAAEYLDSHKDAWPHETAAYMGISIRTLQLWTSGEDEAYEAFQRAYVPALVKQAKHMLAEAELQIQQSEDNKAAGPRVSWITWRLAKVAPRFFGDQKEQAAVTINNLNSLQQTTVQANETVLADLAAEAAVNPELRAALKGVLGE